MKKMSEQIENCYRYDHKKTLAYYALTEHEGFIRPLILPSEYTGGAGLMNPSILSKDGVILCNIRHVNYTFYHSEKKLFQHPWGPLTYLHPENDLNLRTLNWIVELNDDLSIKDYAQVDTSENDVNPLWTFVGLEDGRLVFWNNELYLTGVRRDTTINGQGRMELSRIEIMNDKVYETSRYRIPTPFNKDTYCEKNWMPVESEPFTYVKWSIPTEIVKVNIESNECIQTHLVDQDIDVKGDIRGGSQVIDYKDGKKIAIIHQVDLFQSTVGRKDGVYRHMIVEWDENWNITRTSDSFSIMGGHVEFCCGLTNHNDKYIMTYGFQDNAAYVLSFGEDLIERALNKGIFV